MTEARIDPRSCQVWRHQELESVTGSCTAWPYTITILPTVQQRIIERPGVLNSTLCICVFELFKSRVPIKAYNQVYCQHGDYLLGTQAVVSLSSLSECLAKKRGWGGIYKRSPRAFSSDSLEIDLEDNYVYMLLLCNPVTLPINIAVALADRKPHRLIAERHRAWW